jgi:hypothetical protein
MPFTRISLEFVELSIIIIIIIIIIDMSKVYQGHRRLILDFFRCGQQEPFFLLLLYENRIVLWTVDGSSALAA